MDHLWKMFTSRLGTPLAYHPQGTGELKLAAVDIVSKTAKNGNDFHSVTKLIIYVAT